MSGMTLIVKTIARFLSGIIILFGIYVITHETMAPGGGFAGGVIVASGLVLLILAYGKDVPLNKITNKNAPMAERLKTILILPCIGLLIFWGTFIFSRSGLIKISVPTIIKISDLAIGLTVGFGIFLMFLVLSIFRVETGE